MKTAFFKSRVAGKNSSESQTTNHYLWREGFSLQNLHLLWFPKARKLYLTEIVCPSHWLREEIIDGQVEVARALQDRDWKLISFEGNKVALFLATLKQHPLSWINLEVLNLDRNYLTDAHLSLLENMRCRILMYLSLRYNLITDKGALILAKNAFWKKLEVLDLWGNEIKKYKTAILLMKRTNWGNLKALYLPYHKWAKEKTQAILSCQQQELLLSHRIYNI